MTGREGSSRRLPKEQWLKNKKLSDLDEARRRQPSDEDFRSLIQRGNNAMFSGRVNSDSRATELLTYFDEFLLYEDRDLLVINKPSGIPSHYGSMTQFGVQEIARYVKGDTVMLAHRLDRDTSGVLVLTKNFNANLAMTKQFADKEQLGTQKIYLALLDGEFDETTPRKVEVDIFQIDGEKMQIVSSTTPPYWNSKVQRTMTSFDPISLLETTIDSPSRKTLTLVTLGTGKTHQIRVVAAQFLRMPVTGDWQYNPDPSGAGRQMLHAFGLKFQHPRTKNTMKVESPIPPDFQQVLEGLTVVKSYKSEGSD